MKLKIIIVGNGKLANAILSSNLSFPNSEILKWDSINKTLNEKSIIVHAGSGRQLEECIKYCEVTDSVLIELSTGLETEKIEPNFTLIICPNTSILILKIITMMKNYGDKFEDYEISITESHQSTKKSAPGTAYSFANILKYPIDKIKSIRDPEIQFNEIGIPNEYLDKHAFHKIIIKDGNDEVKIETKVLGHNTYSKGLNKIIDVVMNHNLERKRYSVVDLIEKNLL